MYIIGGNSSFLCIFSGRPSCVLNSNLDSSNVKTGGNFLNHLCKKQDNRIVSVKHHFAHRQKKKDPESWSLVHLAARCDAVLWVQRLDLLLHHGSFQTFVQVVEAIHLQGVLSKLLDVAQNLPWAQWWGCERWGDWIPTIIYYSSKSSNKTRTLVFSFCHERAIKKLHHGVLLFVLCTSESRTGFCFFFMLRRKNKKKEEECLCVCVCVHRINSLHDLLSIGSQLKRILEPVEQFVGKLADVLMTRRMKYKQKQNTTKVKISCI